MPMAMAEPPMITRNAAAGFTASSPRFPIMTLLTAMGLMLKTMPKRATTLHTLSLLSILRLFCSIITRKYSKNGA